MQNNFIMCSIHMTQFEVILRSTLLVFIFFFSSRRRHTRCSRDWSSDVCSSDLGHRSRAARTMWVMRHGISASPRSEEHTSELQSRLHLVCRLLLEKKKKTHK